MKLVANQIETHYQQIGSDNKQVLVLLHGWGQSWECWHQLITTLSNQFQLIVPDLPGFGHSQTPTQPQNWNSNDYQHWLGDFISQVTNQPVSLLGHSLGGKVAALYTAHNPKKVKKLFLVAPAGIPDQISTQKKIQKNILQATPQLIHQLIPSRLKNRLSSWLGASNDYQHATRAQKEILKNVVEEDITPQLNQISCPTYLFWGTNDQDTPYKNHHIFLNQIPAAKLIKFEDSGHFPFIDQRKKFINQLQKNL